MMERMGVLGNEHVDSLYPLREGYASAFSIMLHPSFQHLPIELIYVLGIARSDHKQRSPLILSGMLDDVFESIVTTSYQIRR